MYDWTIFQLNGFQRARPVCFDYATVPDIKRCAGPRLPVPCRACGCLQPRRDIRCLAEYVGIFASTRPDYYRTCNQCRRALRVLGAHFLPHCLTWGRGRGGGVGWLSFRTASRIARLACVARSPSLSWASGQPKYAMMPSPRYLATYPPNPVISGCGTTVAIVISRHSSGSEPSGDFGSEPTRSQNRSSDAAAPRWP